MMFLTGFGSRGGLSNLGVIIIEVAIVSYYRYVIIDTLMFLTGFGSRGNSARNLVCPLSQCTQWETLHGVVMVKPTLSSNLWPHDFLALSIGVAVITGLLNPIGCLPLSITAILLGLLVSMCL